MLNNSEQKIFDQIKASLQSGKLPTFPVTGMKKVSVDYFPNVWIKDESSQETGTHKDRMAWKIVMAYFTILKAKEKNFNKKPLPQFSIISAGSAALAIQTQLKKYHLPNLKILVDINTNKHILNHLQMLGCEIFKTNLDDKMLTSEDILNLTHNSKGFDITSNRALDPDIRFYDWMTYEILNENPEYVFIPYGTGQLYENVLNIAKTILTAPHIDSVYKGNKDSIRTCHFIGATSNNPNTLATKLYAPFRPFTQSSPEWVRLFIQQGYCGEMSKVIEVSEEFITKGNKMIKTLGISSEYSGSAGLGLLYQIKELVPRDSKIIVINTGNAKFPNNF